MWRTTTVTLVAAVLLALTAAAALAATIDPITCPTPGQNSNYDCVGTTAGDTMNGTPGPDHMVGKAGNDTLKGNDGDDKIDALNYDYYDTGTKTEDIGEDTVSGGPGNDTIAANDGIKGDAINCGPGSRDIVYSDKGLDNVSSDCEWRRSYDI